MKKEKPAYYHKDEKHRRKQIEQSLDWQQRNKEKVKEYHKEYYAKTKNKKRMIEYRKKYQEMLRHLNRHKRLHKFLDELVADWLTDTGKQVSKSTVFELMQWSYLQTIKVKEEKKVG